MLWPEAPGPEGVASRVCVCVLFVQIGRYLYLTVNVYHTKIILTDSLNLNSPL